MADTAADWFAASKEGTHTFPGQGPYTGQWSSCCRIGSTPAGPLTNNANQGMRMWNTVDLRTFGSNVWKNSSPVSSQVPIQTVVRSELYPRLNASGKNAFNANRGLLVLRTPGRGRILLRASRASLKKNKILRCVCQREQVCCLACPPAGTPASLRSALSGSAQDGIIPSAQREW